MRFFLLILFSTLSVLSHGQKTAPKDVSKVDIRLVSVASYKNDSAFKYERAAAPPASVWDRFWRWIWSKYNQMMSTPSGRVTMNIIYIVAGLAAIVFFVWKVMGMNRMGLFVRKDESKISYEVNDDDIHSIDFNTAIREAAASGNFRLAIRLMYLCTLKSLTDQAIIKWQIDKTNTMYVQEMKGHPQQHHFAELTNVFDHAWYGNTVIDSKQFAAADEIFRQFQKQF